MRMALLLLQHGRVLMRSWEMLGLQATLLLMLQMRLRREHLRVRRLNSRLG